MKILRSVTRRGFTVSTAGWFTVTSPNRWFASSQFREGFQSHAVQSKGTATTAVADLKTMDCAVCEKGVSLPQIVIPGTQDHRWLRLAWGALAAAAFTFFMLWWIAGAKP